MQRRIVIGVLVLGLLMAGALFGYREYLRASPAAIWVPMPVKVDLTLEKRREVCDELKKALLDKELLLRVVKDVDLAKKWELTSDAAAVDQVSKRLFVRPGDMETKNGRMPAIHIGVKGKGWERDVLGEVATRMMQEVFRLMGMEQPKPNGLEAPPI